MSSGSTPCPSVTLPFGVFAGTQTIKPLDPSDFPPADPPPGLEQFIIDNSPTDATALDGFDQVFAETVGLVDALDSALAGLENDLALAFAEADLIDPGPVGDTVAGFLGSLRPSDIFVTNLGTILNEAVSPTPAPAKCSPGTTSSPAPCGTHGQSAITLGDNTYNCDASTAFPRVSIRDGACTIVVPVDNSSWPGKATVTAATLALGDARLWAVSVETAKRASDGACISQVVFKLTPYRTGHFLARFSVTTDRKNTPEVWCVIVDVIA